MSDDDVGVIDVLSAMTTVIDKTMKKSNMQSPKGQDISMLLYGLQNMSSEGEVIRHLILVLVQMITECGDTFAAQAVGNALYGLKGMSSECAEVRDVMSALVIKIRSCKEDLKAQEVGNALYGLQGMSSECAEVRDVMSALAIKIRSSKDRKRVV